MPEINEDYSHLFETEALKNVERAFTTNVTSFSSGTGDRPEGFIAFNPLQELTGKDIAPTSSKWAAVYGKRRFGIETSIGV